MNMGIKQYTYIGIEQYTRELSNKHGNQATYMGIRQYTW